MIAPRLASLLASGLCAPASDDTAPQTPAVAATNIVGAPPAPTAAPAAQDPLLGRVIQSQYTIETLVGQGGFSSIYRADQPSLQRKVAIKTIHPHLSRNQDAIERFRREGLAISRLRHPSAVEIYALGAEPDGLLWIAMEFLVGEDLRARLAKVGTLSPALLLSLLAPVCELLADAHEEGIIHRDLKPENLFLVSYKGRDLPKVLDFGMAGFQSASGQSSSMVGGTFAYMPPEQWRGLKHTDARSDVYALGVIAYECLTGRTPFQAEPEAFLEWAEQHLHQQAQDPRETPQGAATPSGVAEAVLQALEKDPDARFQSPLAFLAALQAGFAGSPVTVAPRATLQTPHPSEHRATPSAEEGAPTSPAQNPSREVIVLRSADLIPVEAVSPKRSAIPALPVYSEDDLVRDAGALTASQASEPQPWRRSAVAFLRGLVDAARAALPFAPEQRDDDPEDAFFQAVGGLMLARAASASGGEAAKAPGARVPERPNVWWESTSGARYSLFVRGGGGLVIVGMELRAPEQDARWAALALAASPSVAARRPGCAWLGRFYCGPVAEGVAGVWCLSQAQLEEEAIARETAARFAEFVARTWPVLSPPTAPKAL